MSATLELLLVEDDADLRYVFQRRLERRGFAVTAVADPQTALSAAAERSFHVALVDRTLPSPGGEALLRELRRRDAALPIIVMSGEPAERWADEVRARGAAACLVKPFALDELEAALRSATRTPSPV